ncbi:N/A [soil metagenome]
MSSIAVRRRIGAMSDTVGRFGMLGSLLNHRRPALLAVALFTMLGLLAIIVRPPVYDAEASLIVEDSRAKAEYDVTGTTTTTSASQASERYLSDQVEIMKSARVARIASERLADRGIERGTEALLRGRTVTGEATSNLITVRYEADDPRVAKRAADALALAYVELRTEQVQTRAERARREVDALQAALREDLDDIEQQVEDVRDADEARRTLQQQFDEALAMLNELRQRRSELPAGSSERSSINNQIDELRQDFTAWDVVLSIERQSSELNALTAQRDQVISEIAALTARGNSIAVDAELEAGGVVLSDPATLPQRPSSTSPTLILVASFVLGIGVAAALAYYLDMQNSAVAASSAPANVLGAPLLAVVPAFRHEGIESDVPVFSAPASVTAEAFRFAATALDVRASTVGARSVLMTSASVGAGKTVATANTGIAAASEGLHILLVDADLGSQQLTSMLNVKVIAGLAEVAAGTATLSEAIKTFRVANNRYVSVLTGGLEDVDGPTFVRSERVRQLFKDLRERFDLVIIDGPPLLQVAYASTLATMADSTIVVVKHGSPTQQLDEVAARLEVVETPVLGYLYSHAPLSRQMMMSEGSAARHAPDDAQQAHPSESGVKA